MCLSTFQNKGDGDCCNVNNLLASSSITIGRGGGTIDCSGLDAVVGSESP